MDGNDKVASLSCSHDFHSFNSFKEFITPEENDIISNANSIQAKIDRVSKGQKPYIKRILSNIGSQNSQNAETICDFIIAERNEINIKEQP